MDEQHQFASDGATAEEVWELGEIKQPVGVPRCPIIIGAVDDAEDLVVGLA